MLTATSTKSTQCSLLGATVEYPSEGKEKRSCLASGTQIEQWIAQLHDGCVSSVNALTKRNLGPEEEACTNYREVSMLLPGKISISFRPVRPGNH